MGKELGSTLAILRKKAGLTQEQAAEKMLLKNKSTLASWECGKAEPSIATFLRLVSLYGIKEAEYLHAVLVKTALGNEPPVPQSKPFAFCPYCGEKLNPKN